MSQEAIFNGFEPIHNDLIQGTPDERAQVLDELLLENHTQNALLHHGALHNHLPHILCSAYLMGSSKEHLKAVYDDETSQLERWPAQSFVVSDVRENLGKLDHQQAYLKFFEQDLQSRQGSWKEMLSWHLFKSNFPLIGGVVGGFGHPLILIADAYELSNPNVAVEALALTAIDFNPLHQLLDTPSPVSTSPAKFSAVEILHQIRSDERFNNLLSKPGVQNTLQVLSSPTAREATLNYFQALNLTPSTPQKELVARHIELTELSVLLLSTTHKLPKSDSTGAIITHKFDFYLTHMLTLSSALRVLLPIFPLKHAHTLLKAQWLLMVLTYITQLRPLIKPEILEGTSAVGSNEVSSEWNRLNNVALGTEKNKGMDAHFVKVIRSLRDIAGMRDDPRFLVAAVRFEAEFAGWTGFGAEGEEVMDVLGDK